MNKFILILGIQKLSEFKIKYITYSISNMTKKEFLIYSLATTYPESIHSKRPKFVHLLNKELVKQGVRVKVITPHFQGIQTSEIMDSVFIKRFRYLPSKYEINDRSIPDEMKKIKVRKA